MHYRTAPHEINDIAVYSRTYQPHKLLSMLASLLVRINSANRSENQARETEGILFSASLVLMFETEIIVPSKLTRTRVR